MRLVKNCKTDTVYLKNIFRQTIVWKDHIKRPEKGSNRQTPYSLNHKHRHHQVSQSFFLLPHLTEGVTARVPEGNTSFLFRGETVEFACSHDSAVLIACFSFCFSPFFSVIEKRGTRQPSNAVKVIEDIARECGFFFFTLGLSN